MLMVVLSRRFLVMRVRVVGFGLMESLTVVVATVVMLMHMAMFTELIRVGPGI